MSYCRWGEDGSDVYVIGTHDGEWWCVQCKHEGAIAHTPTEMIVHLQIHRNRGDTVPNRAFERLQEELGKAE
jgi:hypothetical protein